MRMPMVSTLCLAFVSASFPHPAVAQVNPSDPQSLQAQRPTVRQQSAPELPTLFAFQEAARTPGKLFNGLGDLKSFQDPGNLLTAPLPNRPDGPGWHQDWHRYGAPPELERCARCAHIQIYKAPDIDAKIIVGRIPYALQPLLKPVPPSDPDMPIYHGLQPCPEDFHPYLPIHR